ncbi:PIN domain-containing protein [Xanthomonas campestris]|uniref:PIN domain-containing protein n=1 Tax=Xanthomonas campestris TaxID=339 RepID=UPI001E2F69CC|nr:PIN domain-containing protein [Xanthomonas campestris]MCC5086711.1 PIN domain-containing protein [Xanthomonas campestris]
MILLDTSVISELWRPQPNPHVVGWIDAQAVETLFLSVVTVAELRFGIAVMPEGRKRSTLHSRLEQVRTHGKSHRATSSRP